jgi:hypothetical protein
MSKSSSRAVVPDRARPLARQRADEIQPFGQVVTRGSSPSISWTCRS